MSAVGSVDVELELMQWLRSRIEPGTVVRDELDNQLLAELPTIQVERLPGGDDDGLRLDRALVDINVYAATRGEALALAAQVRGWLLAELPGAATATAVFTRVDTVTAPAIRPYENTGLRRAGATYQIYSHPA
ncbi:phage tail termination protein [Streptomyces fradiae]|uniref:phage tail termination protein n=1 Tax=Streptomyces fradiae TaxID=1906 RepID=UPI0036F56293